jgi:hypothetical protein
VREAEPGLEEQAVKAHPVHPVHPAKEVREQAALEAAEPTAASSLWIF